MQDRSYGPMASVVVATYGRPITLVGTLQSLADNSYGRFEVIVVDQTRSYSESEKRRLAATVEQLGARYIHLDRVSLTHARNIGWRASRGDVVIFCDDDVLVESDYVASHVRCFADEDVGGVAGRVVAPAAASDTDCRTTPTGRVLRAGHFVANFDSTVRDRDVDFGMGCNMAFRISALTEVNGFDERYSGNFYREEGDVFAQIKRRRWRVVYEPAAKVIHLSDPVGGCRKDQNDARLISTFRNETLYFLNCRPRRDLPHFAWRLGRWMYATIRSHSLGPAVTARLVAAPFVGAAVHFCQDRQRLGDS